MAVSVSVVTTNGITSAEYKWNQGGCEDMDSIGPLIRKGSHFSYNFDLKWKPECFPQYVIAEHTTVVLGALSPGTYTLITTSWGVPVATTTFTVPKNSENNRLTTYKLVANNHFTVPKNSAPILHPIGFVANESFQTQKTASPTRVTSCNV